VPYRRAGADCAAAKRFGEARSGYGRVGDKVYGEPNELGQW